MTRHLYRATFEDNTVREQIYARSLTHAWKVTYTYAANPDSEVVTKTGFSGSRERAEAACKLGKRYKLISSEIVHAMKLDAPATVRTVKPKKVKPFHKGDEVLVQLTASIGFVSVPARVQRVGRDYAYVTIGGIMTDVKVKISDCRKQYEEPSGDAPMAVAA